MLAGSSRDITMNVRHKNIFVSKKDLESRIHLISGSGASWNSRDTALRPQQPE